MNKSFRTFLAIAGAAICIGAAPLAMSQFATGNETSGKTLQQTLREWRDSARAARQKLEAEARVRQARVEAQEAANLKTIANYHFKCSACQRQASEQGLHFLHRMTFIHECMRPL